MEDYEIIGWPDIQDLMDKEGFEQNSTLITPNDDLGIGSSTYLVDKEWYKIKENNCREEKMRLLRKAVQEKGGKISFYGNFKYDSIDIVNNTICSNTELLGIELKNNKLKIHGYCEVSDFIDEEECIPNYEIDRLIDYVKNYESIIKALKDNIHQVILKRFSGWDLCDIAKIEEAIYNEVAEDVIETSDYPNYTSEDIEIAIKRSILNLLCNDK